MKRALGLAALLCTSTLASPALAEDRDLAGELAAMHAEIDSLKAEVAELKAAAAARDAVPSPAAVAGSAPGPAAKPEPPAWRGAPQFSDKGGGFSFKPKGLVQFDAGFVGTPGPELAGTVGGLNYNNLGWNGRARRLVIGAEGTLPGGFGYNFELNFAQGSVDYEDIVLTYQRPKSPIQVRLGNFYPLSSLETMTSSRLTSFLERAAFTDAFNYNRRLGVAVALLDPDSDRFTLTAGLFGQEINNGSFSRTGWQTSLRGTFAPTVGGARLHLGANFQHRVAQRDAQNVQYRSRPSTQVTDQRFVDTGAIAAAGDDIAGLEFGAIVKSFHVAAEAQQVWVRGYRPGRSFGPNNGAGGGLFYAADPRFRSAYAELGFYFTGETRGYKNGRWDRPKTLHPVGDGGWGALQLNARLDWLDLSDRVRGDSLAAPDYVNGGRQLGFGLSLIWNPIDYVRFQAQYAHGAFEGGPRAATIDPASSRPVNLRDFDVDTFGLRAQAEF
jgi:phosphate-selective porin OprO and OprP